MSAMEMMINAAIKSLGIDPQQLLAGLQAFITATNDKLAGFERRTAALEASTRRIEEQNELILAILQGKVVTINPAISHEGKDDEKAA